MKPDTRRRRHAQLWESGTISARRVAITGVIFAILMILRVVEPYHLEERKAQEGLAELEGEQEEVLERQKQLGLVETVLQEIENEIKKSPWNVEIVSLKKYFVDLRANGYESDEIPQDMANKTITNIGKLVKERVIDRLREVTDEPGTSKRLAKYPNTIQKALDKWTEDNYGNTEWYFTPESKDATIRGMSKVLAALEEEALGAVADSRKGLELDKKKLKDSEAEIKANKEEAEEIIEDALYDILPDWAEDSVGVRSMIIFYPWILVAFAATMVGNALIAARHFHGMADEEQWTAVERRDPLLSTPWTLTRRGLPGTVITIFNYVSVIVIFGVCLFWVVTLVSPEVEEASPEAEGASSGGTVEESSQALADAMSAVLPLEFAYGLLLATLAVVVATPLWRRSQKT